jgi:hypothetical protein
MGSLLNDGDRNAILARLGKLTPDTPRLWGSLDAPRMLCHVTDQLRVALGAIPAKRTDSLMKRTLLKWLVVHTGFQPPPGKIATAPEMLTSKPAEWAQDLADCKQLIVNVGAGAANAVHPAFGPLDATEWGTVCWKHLDHHFRQFGL